MVITSPKPRKPAPKGEYRNLKLMDGSDELWEFEVKLKDGSWKAISGLRSDYETERQNFAQQTANVWIRRNPL